MKHLKINPEVHRMAKQAAASLGKFLQDFVEQAIRAACDQANAKPRGRRKAG